MLFIVLSNVKWSGKYSSFFLLFRRFLFEKYFDIFLIEFWLCCIHEDVIWLNCVFCTPRLSPNQYQFVSLCFFNVFMFCIINIFLIYFYHLLSFRQIFNSLCYFFISHYFELVHILGFLILFYYLFISWNEIWVLSKYFYDLTFLSNDTFLVSFFRRSTLKYMFFFNIWRQFIVEIKESLLCQLYYKGVWVSDESKMCIN